MNYEAHLTVEQGPSSGTRFVLTQLPAVIGRLPSLEVAIDDRQISRMHARVSQRGKQYFIEDLGSSNGTFVNGERVTSTRPLYSGDQIGLGQYIRFRFELKEGRASQTVVLQDQRPTVKDEESQTVVMQPPDATVVMPGPSSPAKASESQQQPGRRRRVPRLTITLADGSSKSYALTAAEITIGRRGTPPSERAPDNDITIDSPVVSRQHMRLIRQDNHYLLQVLPTASNPVLLAGRPLTGQRALEDGDEMTIGHTVPEHMVRLRYQSAPATAPETLRLRSGQAAQPARKATVVAAPETFAAEPGTETVIGEILPLDSARGGRPETAPMLVITIAGQEPKVHSLSGDEVSIGRAPDNDIVIQHKIVSRHQAQLKWLHDGYELIPLPDTTNPLSLDGKLITQPTRLHHGSKLRVGGEQAGELVTVVYVSPAEAGDGARPQTILFKDKNQLTIGRDKTNDIVLSAPTVSRFHAQVERAGQRYRLRDLRSSNGTFVNGHAVAGDVWLKAEDTIRIGPYRFVLGANQLTEYDESQGLRVEAVGLNKWVRKDLNILQDISLSFQPSEFVVVVGQSGGGKSTLVDAIAGYRPASHGRVYVNDVDVFANFDAIRSLIGFVPQRDIIHMELTVFQALDYAAQLRMPPDTTREERHRRVLEVLEDLDLAHRKDVQISGLSGGQQKRVSIGVELLTKPGLFFLDEPTSGLDPGTETALMQLMRRLADQGRTIVLVTHATKNVMLADKVIFLARGGYLAWFGPPEEALAYFDQYRSERERRTKQIEFDDIYNLLDDPNQGTPVDWAERYQKHTAYRQYIAEPLQKKQQAAKAAPGRGPAPGPQRVSALRQFLILSARNLKILTRDRSSLILMLLVAPLIGVVDFVMAAGMGRNPFAFADGDMNRVIISFIVLTNNAILVGGLSQMRELIKERDIYRRERLVNLRLLPYIMSKVWVAVLLAFYMAAVFLVIRTMAFDIPGGAEERLYLYVSLLLLIAAGMMMGLFASALAPNGNAVPLILVVFLLPQIVLSGAMVPLPSTVTMPASSRWAFQAFMGITGGGSDVAHDICWQLPEEEQRLLTSELKRQHCNCMGTPALQHGSCSFPGLGEYYDEAIDRADPEEPAPIRDEPEPLILPPEPERPANPNDPVAQQQYLAALLAYNETVTQLRQAHEVELASYRVERELHQTRLAAYQAERSELEVLRASAVGSAEARIRFFYDDYGWTFVDKSDEVTYRGTILKTWLAQFTIILLLLTGTIIMQRRRDVA